MNLYESMLKSITPKLNDNEGICVCPNCGYTYKFHREDGKTTYISRWCEDCLEDKEPKITIRMHLNKYGDIIHFDKINCRIEGYYY